MQFACVASYLNCVTHRHTDCRSPVVADECDRPDVRSHRLHDRLKKDNKRYFDRELSWLAFNERVLQEAESFETPLLERLKFLAIFSSNLDEFFRVRVASIRSLLRLKEKKLEKLGYNPQRLLLEIHQVVDRQQRRFGELFRNSLLPELRTNGIFLHVTGSSPEGADYFLRTFFANELAQHINPVLLEASKEPPFLKNGGLYLVVPLWPKEERNPIIATDPVHGLVEVPAEHTGRFVQVAREPGLRHFMFVDDILRYNLSEIFPFHDVGEAYEIKLTRDAELYIEDEFSVDLVEAVRKSLKKRETGVPTRLLFDQRIPYPVVTTIKDRLSLRAEDLVVGGFYHNFSDFFRFPDVGRSDLKFEPLPPLEHAVLTAASSVTDAARSRDHIIHLPYQSFDPVLRLIGESAARQDVTRVSIALYRVAPDSEVVRQLIEAAHRGKEVHAFVEVKARFDEQPNLDWARRMEDAGIKVNYSLPGIKVHAKLLLVESSDADVAYLSTGNFNEKTARLYTDHGMFTADPEITSEVALVFRMLEQPGFAPEFSTLLVAPAGLRSGFEHLVEHEIEAARGGKPASIVLKMNSLEDEGMIDLLYRASQSGVRTRLLVRGICRLIPGQQGLSDNIEATSIVDRFLEHARVYAFEGGGDNTMLLSSADWMSRNLDRRIEVAWPVKDPVIRTQIQQMLELQIRDTTKSRVIDRWQTNAFVSTKRASQARAQTDIYRMLAAKQHAPVPEEA